MTDTEFDIHRFARTIDHSEQRMHGPAERLKTVKHAIVAILLRRYRPLIRHLIGDTFGRREIDLAQVIEFLIENRIGDEIPLPKVEAQDRPDLTRSGRRIPVLLIDTEFKTQAVKEGAVLRVRRHERRAQLEPIIQQLVIGIGVHRKMQPKLPPGRHAQRPFGEADQRMIGV
jgi:hypothetical protein